MKKLILCAICVLGVGFVFSQDVTILQINAEWNKRNNYDLSGITNATVKFSYLKDQPKEIQKSIIAVPVIVIMDKKGRVRMQYVADISLKIKVGNLDIQNNVNRISKL